MTLPIQFTKKRIPELLKKRAEVAARRLTDHFGERFRPVKASFGRHLACELGGFLLVCVSTFSRPPRSSTVVISTGPVETILVPLLGNEDFELFCKLADISSESDREAMWELFRFRRPLVSR